MEPTLEDYFARDFPGHLTMTSDAKLDLFKDQHSTEPDASVMVKLCVRVDMHTSARFSSYLLPDTLLTFDACANLIKDWHERGRKDPMGLGLLSRMSADEISGHREGTHLNKIVFYTLRDLSGPEKQRLDEFARAVNLELSVRGSDYVKKRNLELRPIAFISHDSRDKALIAEPLAWKLTQRLHRVWHDAFSLTVGDSLRASIEKGIRETKKCILVLTQNYLNNQGWGKKEFDSIFTRELVMNERVILPIWFRITKEELYNYSTALPDCAALHWPDPDKMSKEAYDAEVESVVNQLDAKLKSMDSEQKESRNGSGPSPKPKEKAEVQSNTFYSDRVNKLIEIVHGLKNLKDHLWAYHKSHSPPNEEAEKAAYLAYDGELARVEKEIDRFRGYYSKGTGDLLDKAMKEIKDAQLAIQNLPIRPIANRGPRDEAMMKDRQSQCFRNVERLNGPVPNAIGDVDEELRKLLGVEANGG